MSLTDVAYQLEQYGPVLPTTVAEPIRHPQVRFTDGLGLEEGTTNRVLNPRGVALANWGVANGTLTGPDAFGFVTVTCTAAGAVGILIGTTAVSSATTYSLSLFTDTARTVQLDYGGTSAVSPAGPRRTATVLTVNSTDARLGVSILSMAAGEKARLSLPQVEQKPYVTSPAVGDMGLGYSWTGAANASTSVRAAARLRHPLPPVRGPLTMVAFVKVGILTIADSFAATLEGGGANPALTIRSGIASFSSLLDAAAAVALPYVAGDLVFLAGVLNAAGTGYSIYASKNGAAPGAPGVSGTSAGVPVGTVMEVGGFGGGNHLDGGLEQLLVYNRALTPAEISALATGGPVDFPDDTGIVYATATKSTRGTRNALTTAGSGSFRTLRQFQASLDANLPGLTVPGARRLSVPAGTGLGPGDTIRFGDRAYAVTTLHASGGQFDELVVVPNGTWRP